MDEQRRATNLDDLAADASRRRDEFLSDAGRQFVRFLDANRKRLKDLGGLVLIDEEPDYLSVSEEGAFSSRTRFQDDDGEWVSETEEIEDPTDLIEIYNPADLYAAFMDAAEVETAEAEADEAEAEAEDAAADDGEAEVEPIQMVDEADEDEGEPGLYEWLDHAPLAPRDQQDAARLMYDLALTFQEGSQFEQARLLDDFQSVAAPAAKLLGDSKFVEDDDERLWLRSSGAIEGEVVPARDDEAEGEPDWQPLPTSDDMVQFYDPTDLFGDLAEAIADSHPEVAPELSGDIADGDGASDEG